MDFEIAGSLAFKDAYRRAAPLLLEPIMRAVTHTPDTYVGAIVSDFGGRRGQITQMALEGADTYVVEATVPLSSMFGYVTVLRDRTSGRGTFTSIHALRNSRRGRPPDHRGAAGVRADKACVRSQRQDANLLHLASCVARNLLLGVVLYCTVGTYVRISYQ